MTKIKVNPNFHVLTGKNILDKSDPAFREYRRKWESMTGACPYLWQRAKLGWEPMVSIKEGLRRCVDWFKEYEEGSGLK